MPVLRVTFAGNSLQEFARNHLADLSSAGMFIRYEHPLQVGTRLQFEFVLENGEPLLSGQAVVVWVTEATGRPELPPGMELRFEALTLESESRFEWLQLVKRGSAIAVLSEPGGEATHPDLAVTRRAASTTPDEEFDARSTTPYRMSEVLPDLLTSTPEEVVGEVLPLTRVKTVHDQISRPGDADLSDPDPDLGQLFHRVAPAADAVADAAPDSGPPPSAAESVDLSVPRNRWPWVLLLASVIVVLGAVGGHYRTLWRAGNSDTSARGRLHLLRLASDPAGARVLVDGIPAGHTPLEVPVKPTSLVRLELPERRPLELGMAGQRGWTRDGEVSMLELRVRLALAAPRPVTVSAPNVLVAAALPSSVAAAAPAKAAASKPKRTLKRAFRSSRRHRAHRAQRPRSTEPSPSSPSPRNPGDDPKLELRKSPPSSPASMPDPKPLKAADEKPPAADKVQPASVKMPIWVDPTP